MKHVENKELIDFVNRLMDQGQMDRIQTHLSGGCKGCERRLETWSNVRRFAEVESIYQPPEQVVRVAKGMFRGRAPRGGNNNIVEVLFDSFRRPMIAGVRVSGTGVRQLLFRAGGYEIDLQVERRSAGQVALVGQIKDACEGPTCGSAFHVVVRNRSGHSLHTASNENGEFYLEVRNSHDVELMLLGARRPIVIFLGDPQEDTPGERK